MASDSGLLVILKISRDFKDEGEVQPTVESEVFFRYLTSLYLFGSYSSHDFKLLDLSNSIRPGFELATFHA